MDQCPPPGFIGAESADEDLPRVRISNPNRYDTDRQSLLIAAGAMALLGLVAYSKGK